MKVSHAKQLRAAVFGKNLALIYVLLRSVAFRIVSEHKPLRTLAASEAA